MKAKHGILYLLLAIFSSSCIREEAQVLVLPWE